MILPNENEQTIIDINPDAENDELAPELTTIYGYNPDSQMLSHVVETILTDDTIIEDFTTLTIPPVYDNTMQNIKYHPDTDKWEVVDIANPLEDIKTTAKAVIDVEIKTITRKLITFNAQNAGLYDLKYAESIRYIKSGSPDDLVDYPFLQIGVDVSSMNATDYANLIIAKHDEYNQKLLEMEAIRSKGKADIDAVKLGTATDTIIATTKINKIAEIASLKLYNL